MKLKGHGWTYTGSLLCTLLDEAEGANDGHALGPLLGAMLDETEGPWMDLHWLGHYLA